MFFEEIYVIIITKSIIWCERMVYVKIKANRIEVATTDKNARKIEVVANRKKSWYRDRDFLQLLSMISIPALLVFVFNYIPMAGIVIAFKNYKYNLGIFKSEWSGMKNFTAFIKSYDFPILLKNTVFNNVLFIFFGILAAVVTALLLYKVTSRLKTKVFQTIMILPHFVSWVLVSYLVYILLAPDTGLLNKMFEVLNIPTVDWYNTPAAWPVILTIVSIWKHFGMDLVVYYAALMGIDSSILEAGDIDGASEFQKIWHIILPTIRPLIIMLTILKIGNIFRADFGLFYNVTRNIGTLYDTTDVFDTYIFRMTREQGNFPMASAAGFMQSVVGLVTIVIANKISKKIDPNSGIF